MNLKIGLRKIGYEMFGSHIKTMSPQNEYREGVAIILTEKLAKQVTKVEVVDNKCVNVLLSTKNVLIQLLGIYFPPLMNEEIAYSMLKQRLCHYDSFVKPIVKIVLGDFNSSWNEWKDHFCYQLPRQVNDEPIYTRRKRKKWMSVLEEEGYINVSNNVACPYTHSQISHSLQIMTHLDHSFINASEYIMCLDCRSNTQEDVIKTSHCPLEAKFKILTALDSSYQIPKYKIKDTTNDNWEKFNQKVLQNQCEEILGRSINEAGEHLLSSLAKAAKEVFKTKRPSLKKYTPSRVFLALHKTLRVRKQVKSNVWVNEEKIRKTNEFLEAVGLNIDYEPSMEDLKCLLDNIITELRRMAKREYQKIKAERIEKALKKRNEFQPQDMKSILDSILNREKKTEPIGYVTIENQSLDIGSSSSLLAVKNHMYEWFKGTGRDEERQKALEKFQDEFLPKSEILPSMYDKMNENITIEELNDVLQTFHPKRAGGLSGIVPLMLIKLEQEAKNRLLILLNRCLHEGNIPESWLKSVILPIPKVKEWTGNLNQIRPIVLVECLKKVLMKLVTIRVSEVIHKHELLKGFNYGSTPKRSTQDAAFAVKLVIDDAKLQKKFLSVTQIDAKRAFDSVPFEIADMALRRINVPQNVIKIYLNGLSKRTCCVLTRGGLTEEFSPRAGIEQGGAESPLLWLIIYDIVLCTIDNSGLGYQMQKLKSWELGISNYDEIEVGQVGFVDDLNLLSDSLEKTKKLITLTSDILFAIGIDIQPTKTKLFGNEIAKIQMPKIIKLKSISGEINILPSNDENQSFVVLGSIMSMNKEDQLIESINGIIEGISGAIKYKKVTQYLMRYISQNILLSKLKHMIGPTPIGKKTLDQLQIKWKKVLKTVLQYPKRTLDVLLYCDSFLGFTEINTEIQNYQLCKTLKLRGSNCKTGKILRIVEQRICQKKIIDKPLFELGKLEITDELRKITSNLLLAALNSCINQNIVVRHERKETIVLRTEVEECEFEEYILPFYKLGLLTARDVIKAVDNRTLELKKLGHGKELLSEFIGVLRRKERRKLKNTNEEAVLPSVIQTSSENHRTGTVEIWTDGSCCLETQRMGAGYIIIDAETSEILCEEKNRVNGSVSSTTAEYWAIILALKKCQNMNIKKIEWYCDSKNAILFVEQCKHNTNNYQSLIKQTLSRYVRETVPIMCIKVAAHSGIILNDRVDELAKQALDLEIQWNQLDYYLYPCCQRIEKEGQQLDISMEEILWKDKQNQYQDIIAASVSHRTIYEYDKVDDNMHKIMIAGILCKTQARHGRRKNEWIIDRYSDQIRWFAIRRMTNNLYVNSVKNERNLASDGNCRACGQWETIQHMYECEHNAATFKRIYDEFNLLVRENDVGLTVSIEEYKEMCTTGKLSQRIYSYLRERKNANNVIKIITNYTTRRIYKDIWLRRCAANRQRMAYDQL